MGYGVQHRLDGAAWASESPPVRDTTGPGTSHTVTGLTNGRKYHIRVTPCNRQSACLHWSERMGFSHASVSGRPQASPPPPPVNKPGRIQDLTLTPGDHELGVRWRAPSSNGGRDITRYQVRYKPAAATAWISNPEVTSGTETTVPILTGDERMPLTNGVSHHVQVRACNGPTDLTDCGNWTQQTGTPEAPRPQNLDVTPENPEIVRRALLTWSHLDGAQGYVVQVRPVGEASTNWETVGGTIEEFGTGPRSRRGLQLNLSNLMSGGLRARLGYELQLQAVMGKDNEDNDILSPPSDPIILIDTPITSVNGDSRDRELQNDGQAALRWTPIEEILGDGYGGGEYTFLHRIAVHSVNSVNLHHSDFKWRPTDFIGEQTTDPISGTATTITGLLKEQIYAIQLRYKVSVGAKTVKVFAGRDVFVWQSLRPAGGGERVATFPLNHPLKDKSYAYYICNETFPDTAEVTGLPDEDESGGPDPYQTKARLFIQNALEQWELATSLGPQENLVTMIYLGTDCASYETFIDRIVVELERRSDQDIETIRTHLNGLVDSFDLTEFTKQDKARNEIIYVDVTDEDALNLLFSEVSSKIGLASCGVTGDPVACAVPDPAGGETVDILLPERVFRPTDHFDWDIPRVIFSSCEDVGFAVPARYSTLVHEAGHALGIRSGRTLEDLKILRLGPDYDDPQKIHHSLVADSTVKSGFNPCSPSRLDVMVIYALYQSRD